MIAGLQWVRKNIDKLYESGRHHDTPILVGYNSDEGASFSLPKTPEDYVANVKACYGPLAESLLKAYPAVSERRA